MKKILGLFMAILLMLVVFTGCDDTNGNGTPDETVDTKVEFEVISDMDSLPDHLSQMVEAAKKNRGYIVYPEEGHSYVAVLMGEKSTAGYSVDIESVKGTDGSIIIEVAEKSPGEAAAQVISYPFALIKVNSDIQSFRVEKTDGDAYEQIDLIKEAAGVLTGQIDNNSIEIKVDGEFNAFRLDEKTRERLDSIEDGSNVSIVYYENEYGQLMLMELEKAE
ncbi:PrcB C-terminal [Peptoclostridium litorale DSM 5388]|uniref:PrcB C-terminal domain-containing protein n=1 Tax=Peptoclostridium litorale DSM 5388 TaxID=1121324 RepID=A0A069RHR3_PEPLI|nr:protease complex subunit PrcB family protein [Peptoclostridium litorale]KDR96338.1 hypothetical protein CLIT_4c01750 [Peptoclostridium litorale DSM 5388]SIO26615.1 PrcB C-terminal [Peptoclostridium litorale DSM 5388]